MAGEAAQTTVSHALATPSKQRDIIHVQAVIKKARRLGLAEEIANFAVRDVPGLALRTSSGWEASTEADRP